MSPGAAEVCDSGADNNCDGLADDADPSLDPSSASTFYADADEDSYGAPGDTIIACEAPAGAVSDDSDCDDGDAAVNPVGDEVCDGADNNCDGLTDDADPALDVTTTTTFYTDGDSDGFGDDDNPVFACTLPSGAVTDSTDCDDFDSTVNPDGDEVCDGIDNDCDEDVDADDSSVDLSTGSTFYTDGDGDGYGLTDEAVFACEAPAGTSAVDGDCDDLDELISPAADEVCDGADNDCDGDVDDDDSSLDASSGTLFYTDGDNDGYGDSSSSFYACSLPSGAAADDGDCDDAEGAVNPGAVEVCNTGLDEDCSGDENDCGFGGDVLTTDADYSYTGTASVNFGYELASGDWNDDGFMDLAIGAQNAKNTGAKSAAGRVYIAYGPLPSTMTFDLEEDAVFEGVNSSDYLGKSITSGGDLDGDGVPDLLMGAYAYNDGGVSDNGTVVLAYGGSTWSGTISATSADARIYGDLKSDQFGQVVRLIGDVDGDGYDELAVGANVADYGGTNSGVVYIIPGSATRYSGAMAASTIAGVAFAGDTGDRLGDLRNIGQGFDLNGDGLADVALGSVENTTVGTDGGIVYFYYGDSALLYSGGLAASGAADARFLPAGASDNLGEGIGAPGDVDGDGYDELLLGAIGYDDPAGSLSFSGGAFLINGSSTLLSGDVTVSTAATATVTGAAASDNLGAWVSGGDLNNDGLDDLVLGSTGYDYGGSSNTGAAFVFYGPVSGALVATDADALLAGPATGSAAAMGRTATVFDADADGAMDLFVGASSSGTVYGYLGGGL
ncbi:MAG: FG-GAP repeat protein [Deltaproteobacteria bacterium]|nr:FG-GAP repeat protein [Deltaproteobacteria bacterium]